VPLLGARHEHKWRLADAGVRAALANIKRRTRVIASVRRREPRSGESSIL
jgi:hypothetical protein